MSELTHWKQEFNYDYLGSYSLAPNQSVTLTIKETKVVEVMGTDGKKKECFVAYFAETGTFEGVEIKPMILNKTNCKSISKVYGTPYIEEWKGIRIVIHAIPVKAFGEEVEALRIKNVNPDSNLLDEIKQLFDLKKSALTPSEVTAVLKVTAEKQTKFYNRTFKFLKTK